MRTLSIIIPCYNEAQTAEKLLTRVFNVATPWHKEVIVVDDGSTDGTRDILTRFGSRINLIYLEHNSGKGTAVREGLRHATGEYIILQDADLEYDPEDIPSLLAKIDAGTCDVVYGSRNLSSATQRGKFIPRIGVWIITRLINILYGLSLTDVWTCYKLFPRTAAGDFLAGRFESELLFTAALARRNYRFTEEPISYHPRDVAAGKKIRYRDGINAIVAILLDWMSNLYALRFLKRARNLS